MDTTTEHIASRLKQCSRTPRIADPLQAAEPRILVVTSAAQEGNDGHGKGEGL
jgi:hypothetical protein